MPGKPKLYARITTPVGAAAKTEHVKSRHGLCELSASSQLRTTEADEELTVAIYDANRIGSDTFIGAARVPLWTAITEGSQALSAPLLAPAGSTAARRGEPVGEVLMRLKFAVAPRAAAAAAAPQQQWQQQAAAYSQQQQQQQQQWQQQPAAAAASSSAAAASGAHYPTIGAMTDAGGSYPAAAAPWGGAPYAKAEAAPYPQDPTRMTFQGQPVTGVAAAAAGYGQQQQQQQPAGWPQGYPQQPGQQLPMMPVRYDNPGRPAGFGGNRPGGNRPGGGSGPGFGMGLLGGVAAALALDAIF